MAVFIADNNSDCTPPPFKQSSTEEGNAPKSGGDQSSRYENVANSVPGSSRPPPPPNVVIDPLLLHRLSSPRPSIILPFSTSPPLSPATLSGRSRRAFSLSSKPNSCFARTRAFCEHSPLRHFGPWLLLLLYALLGALLFFWLESANERRLIRKEQAQLENLRQQTLAKLAKAGRGYLDLMAKHGKPILIQFEKDLARTKLPDALAWDFLGALFYVQTVFTTIGYGNITPRTTVGQAMSILYAIIGIPLVLALLSQTSKRMTRWLSQKWISYRQRVRRHVQKKRGQREAEEGNLGATEEKGKKQKEEEEEVTESRTIPVWMALALVSGYVCTIAAIFLVWEKRWSYFTSFYFICISCLTIGLGDVIPDHPHMLIIMFVFVIFGLSFVSMLISVIQIKMEEWLYRMLIRMQKEYQKALDGISDPSERDRIIAELFAKEPWYMRELAPLCVSEKESAKLDALAEQFERVLMPTNTRAIQTGEEEEEEGGEEGEGESSRRRRGNGNGKEGTTTISGTKSAQREHGGFGGKLSRTESFQSANSVSDATSLPEEPLCFWTHSNEMDHPAGAQQSGPQKEPPINKEVQTEEGQKVDKGIGTEKEEEEAKQSRSRGTQSDRGGTLEKKVDTRGLIGQKERGIGTEHDEEKKREYKEMEVQTMEMEGGGGGKGKENRRKLLTREESIDEERTTNANKKHRGVQWSPPPNLRHSKSQTEPMAIADWVEVVEGPSQQRERSESVQVVVGDDIQDQLLDIAFPERKEKAEKKDLVIQTDDSYLRIARRLDNLRSAKSEINIYCTGVGVPKRAQSGAAGRRKSLRFLEPAVQQIRDSFRRHGAKEGKAAAANVAGPSQERAEPGKEEEELEAKGGGEANPKSQSLSPNRPPLSPQNSPERKAKKRVRLPPEE